MKYCNHCGASVAPEQKFCQQCGGDLSATTFAAQNTTESPQSEQLVQPVAPETPIQSETPVQPETPAQPVAPEAPTQQQPAPETPEQPVAPETPEQPFNYAAPNVPPTQSYTYTGTPINTDKGSNSLGIASLICGILSFILCCCAGELFGVVITLLVSAAAVILGIMSIKRAPANKTMAIIGIVLGGITLISALISLFMFIVVGSSALDDIIKDLYPEGIFD